MTHRISVRLLAFNLLLAFLPAAAFLALGTYERQLLRALEHALVQQGRVLAAALSGRSPLRGEEAEGVLRQLRGRHEARLRVVDAEGRLLADSSRVGSAADGLSAADGGAGADAAARRPAEGTFLYRLASAPVRLLRRLLGPPQPPLDPGEYYTSRMLLLGPEVREALAGRYGAATRISSGGQRSVTLYSAIPIMDGERVAGAALVSQSTWRILRDLYELRLDVFRVFLLSVAAAVAISLLVATTISGPIRRLRRQALEILDPRGRLKGEFRGGRRRDEIGDLSRALQALTRRLAARLRFIESFAVDLSHEFRNPLTSIGSAAEMIPRAADPAERERFVALIRGDVRRLEHLLAGVREISRIDARLEEEARQPVEARELAGHVVEAFRLRGPAGGPAFRLAGEGAVAGGDGAWVLVAPERLAQVLENLLDNAAGFSPPDGTVEVAVRREGEAVVIRVEDRGPGFPETHLQKVFDRFFTYRPQAGRPFTGGPASAGSSAPTGGPTPTGGPAPDRHTGLGLSIVRAIVEGYGGRVRAANREGGGARLEVRLPAAGRPEAAARANTAGTQI